MILLVQKLNLRQGPEWLNFAEIVAADISCKGAGLRNCFFMPSALHWREEP